MRAATIVILAALLAGCATPSPVFVPADKLCRSWRHQTVSKHDKLTDQTAAGIEGSNEARPAWGCARGANRVRR